MIKNLINAIRLKRPRLALEADYGSSRKAAINLMCFECCGGSISTVTSCKSYSCALWRFRPNAAGKRPDNIVPNKKVLEDLIAIENGKNANKIQQNPM